MADNLPKEFLAERDARIFALKKSGLSNSDIAKRFDMTASAVAAATRRQLNKLNSEAFLSYPEVLRLELERLDEMLFRAQPGAVQHQMDEFNVLELANAAWAIALMSLLDENQFKAWLDAAQQKKSEVNV